MPLISVARKPLGMIHPALAPVAVALKRLQRRGENWRGRRLFAQHRQELPLPFRVKKHQSVLMRKLGDVDMQLQINKVQNLKLAIAHLNGILVPPGAAFSFYQLVGKPTAEKGYLPGVQLIQGKAVAGIGGGLCQLANLIHWLVLHSPLTVTERHHHSFDPFPDEGRVLPFGSGATVFTITAITNSGTTPRILSSCVSGLPTSCWKGKSALMLILIIPTTSLNVTTLLCFRKASISAGMKYGGKRLPNTAAGLY